MLKVKNKLLIGIIVLLFFHAGLAFAQDSTFEATVDNNRVALGSTVQLTLSFKGESNAGALELPKMEGFQVQYLGPSTKVTIINGSFSKTVSHVYNLLPLKVGTLQIPSLKVEIDGKTYISKAINIEVVDIQKRSSNNSNEKINTQRSVSLKDKISLVLEIPKKQIYLHEPVPVTIKLYVNGLSISDVAYPTFEKNGLSVDEYLKPKQYEEVRGGLRDEVIEFNTVIYPTRTGDISIGPAQLTCNIVSRSRRSRSSFGGFDNFFDDFLDRVEKQPITVQSRKVVLNVLPFPEEKKPKNFSGAIGHFNLIFSASPLKVNVGDPVTIRMKVTGQGNLKAVKMPAFKESAEFKVYDPQIKVENGVKILEQVLVPKNEAITEIPQVNFSYFDTNLGEYRSIAKGPISLSVSPADIQGELKVFAPEKKRASFVPEKIGHDIVYIKEKPGKFQSIEYTFYKSIQAKVLFVLITLFFIFGLFYYQRHRRVSSDLAYARNLKAPKQAREGLKEVQSYINRNKSKEFHLILFKVMQHYFGNKFHLSSQGLTVKELEKILMNKSVNIQILNLIKELFEQCDQVRFASATSNASAMKISLEKAEQIIDYFERNVS